MEYLLTLNAAPCELPSSTKGMSIVRLIMIVTITAVLCIVRIFEQATLSRPNRQKGPKEPCSVPRDLIQSKLHSRSLCEASAENPRRLEARFVDRMEELQIKNHSRLCLHLA
jgi:hypothetical protein